MLTPTVLFPGVRGGDLLSVWARHTKLIPVVWGERLGLQFMCIKVVVMLKVQFIQECEEACCKRKWRRKQRRHVESIMVRDVAGELLPARGGTALRDCGLWVGCPHQAVNTGSAARLWPADSSCWDRGAVRNREPWGKKYSYRPTLEIAYIHLLMITIEEKAFPVNVVQKNQLYILVFMSCRSVFLMYLLNSMSSLVTETHLSSCQYCWANIVADGQAVFNFISSIISRISRLILTQESFLLEFIF